MGSIVYISPENTQSTLVADCIEIGENLYFNVKIGNKAGWEIRYSLDSRIYKPKKDKKDKLPLVGNSYTLKPIIKNKDTIKDKNGNIYYVVSKNNFPESKKDTYIFWDTVLSNDSYKILKSKNINIVGKGKSLIDGKEFISLVLEVFGNGEFIITDNVKTFKITISKNIEIKEI